MKVLLAGDQHGVLDDTITICDYAVQLGAELIIVLGDFGYVWQAGESWDFDQLTRELKDRGLKLWWLDGNHENFDALRDEYGIDVDKTFATLNNIPMSETISYLPRGHTFVLDQMTFMAFGGAVSVDKRWRIEGESWWPQELITDEQVDAVSELPVDVLLTHDVHTLSPILYGELFKLDWKLDALSNYNRRQVDRVVEKVTPKAVFHGHYHKRYADKIDGVHIYGLNCGSRPSSVRVIDTEDPSTLEPQRP